VSDEAAERKTVGKLYVCATPIGNLGDVSARLVEVLGSVGAIACEDTRRTRKLLSAIGVPAPRLLSYRLDNEDASAAGLVPLLLGGSDIALVSDAGTPAIADPGVALVRAAHAAGVEVRGRAWAERRCCGPVGVGLWRKLSHLRWFFATKCA